MPFEESSNYLYETFVTNEVNKASCIFDVQVMDELILYNEIYEARSNIKDFDAFRLLMAVYARAFLFGEATGKLTKGLDHE